MFEVDLNVMVNKLKENGVLCECPFCKKSDFVINKTVSSTVPLGQGGSYEFATNETMPLVEVICKNCGYVAHFIVPKK